MPDVKRVEMELYRAAAEAADEEMLVAAARRRSGATGKFLLMDVQRPLEWPAKWDEQRVMVHVWFDDEGDD